jgi:hypothetical protein
MRTIWKYRLAFVRTQAIEMPKGALPLSAQFQGDTLCVWVEVDSINPLEPKTFRIYGTGHDIKRAETGPFLGTVQVDNEAWHVFEGLEPDEAA